MARGTSSLHMETKQILSHAAVMQDGQTSPGLCRSGCPSRGVGRVEERKTPPQRVGVLRRTGDIAVGGRWSPPGSADLWTPTRPFRRRHDPVYIYPGNAPVSGPRIVPFRSVRLGVPKRLRCAPRPRGGAGSSPAGGTIFINQRPMVSGVRPVPDGGTHSGYHSVRGNPCA